MCVGVGEGPSQGLLCGVSGCHSPPCPATFTSHCTPAPERGSRLVSCLGSRGKVSCLSSSCDVLSGPEPGRAGSGDRPMSVCPGEGSPGITLPPSTGPSLSCFHWPRGVQACTRLQQLLEWMRSAGFGAAGEHFFRKLSCTLNLLATPRAQLIQVGGGAWEAGRAGPHNGSLALEPSLGAGPGLLGWKAQSSHR